MTGLANSFDTEADVLNDYMAVGWEFNEIGNGSVLIDDVVFGDIVLSNRDIDAFSHSNIQVYPNPATNYLRIKNAGPTFDVTIFNSVGQHIMYTRNLEQIDISSLDSGLYLVQISTQGERETFKVLVK